MNDMSALDIARRMVQLGETKNACQAYTLAIRECRKKNLYEEEMEAAVYLLQNGGNYKIAYDSFRGLYNRGHFRELCLNIMTEAFYRPNEKLQRTRYEKNCKLLEKYPYIFRKDFPSFEELSIRFYPLDDERYAPFYRNEGRFGENINFNHPVISRNFFKDLDKPILASDVYSMYELEYLNDNVRPSEWVARENHIYLHYTDWETFCAHLAVLNLRELLEDEKIVFLMEDEVEQYPIDFKERFGLDYSQNPVRPIGIREVNRLIWHTQLSAHNGGDLFNEVFDNHPNLIIADSIMLDSIQERVTQIRDMLQSGDAFTVGAGSDGDMEKSRTLLKQLRLLRNRTEKDIFVYLYLCMADLRCLDEKARIVPAIFCQPHFKNIHYSIIANPKGRAVLDSEEYREIQALSFFRQFKYIKTFTPLRRPTTSTAATVRFMKNAQKAKTAGEAKLAVVSDVLSERLVNRSFMVDWQDRLFKDCILVRFEDGKLNPKATFTALAAFLDLPYTESMTYCSRNGEIDPESMAGNTRGFDPATVYRTYEEFMGEKERYLLEYFMRDVYARYGYDFHYYDGAPMNEARVKELLEGITGMTDLIRESHQAALEKIIALNIRESQEEHRRKHLEEFMNNVHENRVRVMGILLTGLRFINFNGNPLNFMPLLKLDPALLEQPLYH